MASPRSESTPFHTAILASIGWKAKQFSEIKMVVFFFLNCGLRKSLRAHAYDGQLIGKNVVDKPSNRLLVLRSCHSTVTAGEMVVSWLNQLPKNTRV